MSKKQKEFNIDRIYDLPILIDEQKLYGLECFENEIYIIDSEKVKFKFNSLIVINKKMFKLCKISFIGRGLVMIVVEEI